MFSIFFVNYGGLVCVIVSFFDYVLSVKFGCHCQCNRLPKRWLCVKWDVQPCYWYRYIHAVSWLAVFLPICMSMVSCDFDILESIFVEMPLQFFMCRKCATPGRGNIRQCLLEWICLHAKRFTVGLSLPCREVVHVQSYAVENFISL